MALPPAPSPKPAHPSFCPHVPFSHRQWESVEGLLNRLTGQQHHMPCAVLLQFLGAMEETAAQQAAAVQRAAETPAAAAPAPKAGGRRSRGSRGPKSKTISLAAFQAQAAPVGADGILQDEDPMFFYFRRAVERVCPEVCRGFVGESVRQPKWQ